MTATTSNDVVLFGWRLFRTITCGIADALLNGHDGMA